MNNKVLLQNRKTKIIWKTLNVSYRNNSLKVSQRKQPHILQLFYQLLVQKYELLRLYYFALLRTLLIRGGPCHLSRPYYSLRTACLFSYRDINMYFCIITSLISWTLKFSVWISSLKLQSVPLMEVWFVSSGFQSQEWTMILRLIFKRG